VKRYSVAFATLERTGKVETGYLSEKEFASKNNDQPREMLRSQRLSQIPLFSTHKVEIICRSETMANPTTTPGYSR
jgi:hypothetical protein